MQNLFTLWDNIVIPQEIFIRIFIYTVYNICCPQNENVLGA